MKYQITIDSTFTLDCSTDELVAAMAARGLIAVKRGYTTWALYRHGVRCGRIEELG